MSCGIEWVVWTFLYEIYLQQPVVVWKGISIPWLCTPHSWPWHTRTWVEGPCITRLIFWSCHSHSVRFSEMTWKSNCVQGWGDGSGDKNVGCLSENRCSIPSTHMVVWLSVTPIPSASSGLRRHQAHSDVQIHCTYMYKCMQIESSILIK